METGDRQGFGDQPPRPSAPPPVGPPVVDLAVPRDSNNVVKVTVTDVDISFGSSIGLAFKLIPVFAMAGLVMGSCTACGMGACNTFERSSRAPAVYR
ncbi:MAG: hypothetical protein IT379_39570 [Deltaproteobacteria bacterium]|nr:hypothetical protein [Deltaproteobacteria bacterium]